MFRRQSYRPLPCGEITKNGDFFSFFLQNQKRAVTLQCINKLIHENKLNKYIMKTKNLSLIALSAMIVAVTITIWNSIFVPDFIEVLLKLFVINIQS